MRLKQRLPCLILAALLLWALPATALAADVDVYAEGAYNATELVVYIYANINTGNLCSYGVKLSYATGELTVGTAIKNDAVWYFGTPADKKPYMPPDTTSEPGKIIFIGGKLDTEHPADGVIGTHVLLGKVSFTRAHSDVGLGLTAHEHFGIGLTLAKVAPYDNFVTTGGLVKDGDGVAFSTAIVRERGDANGNGEIKPSDINAVKSYIGNSNAPCYADCNGSGVIDPISVTASDINCVKSKIQ